jgi:hypothetical protein
MLVYIIKHLHPFLTLFVFLHAGVRVCKKRFFGCLLFRVLICTFNCINHSATGSLAAHRKITIEIHKRCNRTRNIILEYSL